eukprot:Pgem_evm1s830
MFQTSAILTLALAAVVNGHGQATWPIPRPALTCTGRNGKGPECPGNDHPMYFWGGGKDYPRTFDDVPDRWAKNSRPSDFQCRGSTRPSEQQQTLKAGEELEVEINLRAAHPGT